MATTAAETLVLACSTGCGMVARVMPARDAYHDQVRHALERDSWTITHDPLRLKVRRRKLYVDLGAERFLGAEKGVRKIAIEIKTFSGPSDVRDLEDAVGQFVLYEHALRREEPDRSLYLAVSESTWQLVFTDALGEILIDDHVLRVVTFDPMKQEIVRWIP
ncbi:MAG TPA: XisH family protein [Kofleriaceae bacterium]|nr:XisH family protein [Kofleriaceae bacterium]